MPRQRISCRNWIASGLFRLSFTDAGVIVLAIATVIAGSAAVAGPPLPATTPQEQTGELVDVIVGEIGDANPETDAQLSHADANASGATTAFSDRTIEPAEPADTLVDQVMFQVDQTTPLVPAPQTFESPIGLTPQAREFADTILASRDTSLLSSRRRRYSRTRSDVVFGSEAKFRVSTDAGNLLGKSITAPGVQAKSRSPIITDTKVHGSTVGQLIASGSYWFPARQDLDTVLNKIDSRILEDVIIIKGPFAARYGPGFDFIDFQVMQSPRYENGFESHGSSTAEYKSNGEQWYGRQSVWGGNQDYGFRIGYGKRSGSDYHDGNGDEYLSSYQSQDVDIAFGCDLTPYRHLEISYIWLELNDVEVPTQLLDIGHLRTHGIDANYVVEDSGIFDVLTFNTWYNETSLNGNANSEAKREAIPFLGTNIGPIRSNARNMSTGYSLSGDWISEDSVTTVGSDLRYLTQEVNQFSELPLLSPPFINGNDASAEVNGPVPEAYWANPGLFMERIRRVTDRLTVSVGGRVDVVETNAKTVVDQVGGLSGPLVLNGPNGEFPFVYNPNGDPVNVLDPGTGNVLTFPGVQAELDDLLLGDFDRSFGLGSLYVDADYQLNSEWTTGIGFGYGMRAPTMTELYSFQHISTIFPQQTFSILFGNPNLEPERRYQINASLATDKGWYRARVSGFAAWIENYITFDALSPDFYAFQTVNTDLATLVGFDYEGEMDLTKRTNGFVTASYTQGRDRTRTSNAAASAFDPPGSELRSLLAGTESEALPNMLPLQARVGLRLNNGCDQHSPWGLEISALFVAGQSLIAHSLGEMRTPGYSIFDLRGYWRPTNTVTLHAGVENFGDNQYRTHLDPAGRELTFLPGLPPSTATSIGSVFQPGANFYLATEFTY
ncbi:TonB-dependent receptor [Stieleria sp. ICT_E10.1]|uniref:TonB-dependent receptor domain-containing protein n=1 Tax=Stieleria sedimenti TaxID=2976331 RepID=UPI00217FD37D|nr:TonB-dependent receptor [Stieleria sedimenti]MCS7469084.1 TonB-dependent receptor [Stieleria sedimenti]